MISRGGQKSRLSRFCALCEYLSLSLSLSLYIYMHISLYIYIYTHIPI